ncbi:MAG: electron transfer flavoprotein-ubiquinone oxidoreductase [Chlorobiaceae bacterium]|nr:electron transfer flavoprotein-ubiquinone oxidoreductase [Chlorobiaceae bacterium]
MSTERDILEFDILYIGGGPANIASAIHLQRLLKRHGGQSTEIAIIDKGRYAGAHLLSGAVLDPVTFMEFFPDFLEKGCPVESKVTRESITFLNARKKFSFPIVPEPFSSKGCFLVSLSRLGSWLAEIAQEEGIQFFDSTCAAAPVIENGRLAGIVTDDKGIDREGRKKTGFEPGIILKAKAFVIGEGSQGSFLQQLPEVFPSGSANRQKFHSAGMKETWRIPEGRITAGEVSHLFGYPLKYDRYGGGWLYALTSTLLSIGFVTSLGPSSPICDPHLNLQLFKQHPFLRGLLEDGKMIESGARSITSVTCDELPGLYGKGFLVTGESAGMVNLQRQKGIHLAMKSGTLAAETLFDCIIQDNFSLDYLSCYANRFRNSWAFEELHGARNYRKAFDKGLYAGLVEAGLRLKLPRFVTDREIGRIEQDDVASRISSFITVKESFKPDGTLVFGKDLCVYRSGTMHEEDQPCHLHVSPENIREICLDKCRNEFGNPCNHFCPAQVYEVTYEPVPSFRLNASNCLHCKTCEIADPYGIIRWVVPEGGGGPGYKLS